MKARDTEREAARQDRRRQRERCLSLCVQRERDGADVKWLSDEALAAQVGVCAKTLGRWRQSAQFQDAVKAAQDERYRRMLSKLRYPVMFALSADEIPGLVQKCPFCGSLAHAHVGDYGKWTFWHGLNHFRRPRRNVFEPLKIREIRDATRWRESSAKSAKLLRVQNSSE